MAGALGEQVVNGGAKWRCLRHRDPLACSVRAFVQNQDYLWLVSASTI